MISISDTGIDIVRQLDITTAWDRYDFAEQLISDKSDFLGINVSSYDV